MKKSYLYLVFACWCVAGCSTFEVPVTEVVTVSQGDRVAFTPTADLPMDAVALNVQLELRKFDWDWDSILDVDEASAKRVLPTTGSFWLLVGMNQTNCPTIEIEVPVEASPTNYIPDAAELMLQEMQGSNLTARGPVFLLGRGLARQ
jgi:hypothetical protein